MDQTFDPQTELSAADEHTAQLTKVEQQAAEYLDGWKRAKADYLNLRRQSEKEKLEMVQFAQAAAVLQFLPIYTHMKLSLKHIPEDQENQEWVKGVRHIQKQFEDVLKGMGLEPIPTIGQLFDPNKHFAVHKVKHEGAAPGIILEELKPGWMMDDKIIEPAQVTVAE